MAPSHSGRFLLVALAFAAGLTVNSLASRPAAASAQDIVRLASGSTIALATPPLVQVGKRYQITFPGGGPAQTIHSSRSGRTGGCWSR